MKKMIAWLCTAFLWCLFGAAESAAAVEYDAGALDQNWDHKTRMEWWYTSQGSRVIPYDWFITLEQANSTELLSSNKNMERLRFIPGPKDRKWNPDGLPIGFVADKDPKSRELYFGFTCAACHTGQIEYQGKRLIVEGGPARADFDRLITEIAKALQATLTDAKKFERFADNYFGGGYDPDEAKELKEQMAQVSATLGARVERNRPPHPNGYGRLDAFGNIFNEVVVEAIDEPDNAKPANAPVAYPVLWDTPQHDVVQWNGSAVNAGIGPYVRNAGEVVGVFGGVHIEKAAPGSPSKLRYRHHINIKNLDRLEQILTTLWSPVWAEKLLPAIDRAKAQRGKGHYDKLCMSCHQTIDRKDPNRQIKAKLVPLREIGTDPIMADNSAKRMSKTGILKGQRMIPLPNIPNNPMLGAQAHSGALVGNAIFGVLRQGLPAVLGPDGFKKGLGGFLQAKQKNKAVPPSYKARPLNGIWASAPYLHNDSVPNLWELLQKPDDRLRRFHVGSWEMDPVHVGYAMYCGPFTSEFDAAVPANSNQGHDYGTDLSDAEKWELIEYIKIL